MARRKGRSHRRGLARRYGHFGLDDVSKDLGGIKRLARENPLVTSVAIGAAAGAAASGLGATSASMVGALAGATVMEATKAEKL